MCPLTTVRVEAPLFRIAVEPTQGNGLRQSSQVMVDKITTLRRDRLRSTIGRLDQETMRRVDRALAVFLGLA
jgi:mRNA interferase MazF